MTDSSVSPLPKFDDPPVIETVLGVEFSGLDNWGVPHFGLLWNHMRDRFPKWDVKAPLDSRIEEFDRSVQRPGASVQILTEPEMRCWFVDEDDRTLIQIQKDRFIYNWRKTEKGDKYPHYEDSVRPAFELVWNEFNDFVNQEQLGNLNILQCEVTYINHLEIGNGWETTSDFGKVFTSLADPEEGEFLPLPETLYFNSAYQMPDKQGRLHVSVRPAVRNEDGIEVLQLTLTARVKPGESDFESLIHCLDLGREWVVRGFADLTTKRMHEIWKRRV